MKLSQKLLKGFNSLAIGACFLGFTSQVNLVNASTPAVCKDKLTQTTAKENIFSENNAAVATKLDAFNDYGIMRLAAVIFNLKEEGYNINSKTKTSLNRFGEKVNFSEYKIIE